jgi:transcriptional regulator with XRE-family HTH domain
MITKESKETLNYLESLIGKKPSFGDYLLAIRQGDGVSQVEFAKLLGVSRQNLCDIEHNRRFVSPKMAVGFARKLGYSPRHFIRLCLQDLLNRDGIDLLVDIRKVA